MQYIKIIMGYGESILIAVEKYNGIDTTRPFSLISNVCDALYTKNGKYANHDIDANTVYFNNLKNPIQSILEISEKEYHDEIHKVALASDIEVNNPIPEYYEIASKSNVDILYVPKKGEEEGYDEVTFGEIIAGQVIPDKHRLYYKRKNKMLCVDVNRFGKDFKFDYEASTPEKSIWRCIL